VHAHSAKASKPSQKTKPEPQPQTVLKDPVDVVDGIPDRSPRRGRWILLILAAVFIAWMAFLIAVKILGAA
jgi:hypothetical protein